MSIQSNIATLAAKVDSSGNVSLNGTAKGVTGTLGVADGGTGAGTFTSGSLLKGNGTSAITVATSSDIKTALGNLAVPDGGTGATSFTSGSLLIGNGTSAVGAATSAQIVSAIGATAVQNATSAGSAGSVPYSGLTGSAPTWNQNTTGSAASLSSTNFSIIESSGKLVIKYGTTVIASISSTGIITSAADIQAGGTP